LKKHGCFFCKTKENKMKKLLTAIAVGALVFTASADLTGFQWVTSTSVVDNNGVTLTTGSAYVLSVLNASATPDVLSFVTDNKIDIAALQPFSEVGSSTITVAAAGPVAGKWSSSAAVQGPGSWAGSYVYAIITDSASIADISIGDYIGVSVTGGPLNEIQPDPGQPASANQSFNGGAVAVNVQVIPEPATFGLMGIAGLGLFLARKKARR
jgi:hypothetical protein